LILSQKGKKKEEKKRNIKKMAQTDYIIYIALIFWFITLFITVYIGIFYVVKIAIITTIRVRLWNRKLWGVKIYGKKRNFYYLNILF